MKYAHWLSCILFFFTPPLLAQSPLPDLGDPESRYFSPSQERIFGKAIFQQLSQFGALLDDISVADYLQHLGEKLVGAQANGPYDYHFFVINEPNINAFALPGGYIGVHAGLLMAVASEDELAAVMAHEIAHVRQRHIARFLGHSQKVALSSMFGLLAAAAVTAAAPEAGSGVLHSVLASQHQSLINFTRQQEQEADNLGMRILVSAGYDPKAMPAFFRTLGRHTRYASGPSLEYLRTHPLTENRISNAEMRATQYDQHSTPRAPLLHRLIKARLHLSTFPHPREAVEYFLHEAPASEASQYGAALSWLAAGKPLEARPLLEALLIQQPNEPLIQLALVEVEIAELASAKVEARLSALLADHPHHHAATLTYARWLLEEKKPKKSLSRLLELQTIYPQDPETFRLLGEAHAQLGQTVEAYLAQANYRIAQGELHSALMQLRQAKHLTEEDSHARIRIEARLEEVLIYLDNQHAIR